MVHVVQICDDTGGPGWAGGMFGLIVGIVVLALVIWLILIVIDRPIINIEVYGPPQQYVGNNNTTGASTDGIVHINNATAYNDSASCTAGPTRVWTNDNGSSQVHDGSSSSCACIPPFYNTNCFSESYDANYLAIGRPLPDSLTLPSTDVSTVDRLSFPFNADNLPTREQTLCTEICDEDSNCTGVIWQPPNPPGMGTSQASGQCTLLLGDVVVRADNNIPYDPLNQSTLFLKRGINNGAPLFDSIVFLYRGRLALRYWLSPSYNDSDGQLNSLVQNQLVALSFRPTNIINNTGFFGIFNQSRFTTGQAAQVLDLFLMGQDIGSFVISNPSAVPNIPADWIDYFGMYVASASN